jgi:hypothetical protein
LLHLVGLDFITLLTEEHSKTSALQLHIKNTIRWTDRVKNEEVSHTVKEERNILQTVKQKGTANCIGHIWQRKCLLKHVIEGKIDGSTEVTGRQGRRRKQLVADLKTREDTRN